MCAHPCGFESRHPDHYEYITLAQPLDIRHPEVFSEAEAVRSMAQAGTEALAVKSSLPKKVLLLTDFLDEARLLQNGLHVPFVEI